MVLAYTAWGEIATTEQTTMDDVQGLVEVLTVIPALLDRREVRVYFGGDDGGFRADRSLTLPIETSVLSLEAGPAGAKLGRALLENARRHRLRVLGPNCLGVLRPDIGLNATFAHVSAIKGTIGLISQSGALCTSILDWAEPNKVGFSAVVSLGSSSVSL